jgi:hypothetical protein
MGPLFGCFGCLLGLSTATAAEATAGQTPMNPIPVVQIFTFLFLMLGPIKIIGPFAKITPGGGARVYLPDRSPSDAHFRCGLVIRRPAWGEFFDQIRHSATRYWPSPAASSFFSWRFRPSLSIYAASAGRKEGRPNVEDGVYATCLSDDRNAARHCRADRVPRA